MRFADLHQTTFSNKTKYRPLGTQGYIILELQGGLEIDRLAIYLERCLSGHVLDPVLILAEEDLGVVFHYAGMFKAKMTFGVFPNRNGEFLEGAEGRPVLDAQRGFNALNRYLDGPFLYRR